MSPDSGVASQSNASIAVGQKLTLHIGVLDQPYRSTGKNGGVKTTGDVAQILEDVYGLFSAFYKTYEKSITDGIAGSMQGAIEALHMGHSIDPWGAGMQQIQRDFSDFITSGEAERTGFAAYSRVKTRALISVPTKAALRGVNHRLAHPYAGSNPRRPSFFDTGLLAGSGRAWITVG